MIEKWHTQYKWKSTHDTMYISKEIPHIMTDTIKVIKEVPVEKIVYKQRWWQRLLGGCGLVSLIGMAIAIYFNLRKR